MNNIFASLAEIEVWLCTYALKSYWKETLLMYKAHVDYVAYCGPNPVASETI